jgi:suppressor of fused protein SUFU
MLVQEDDSSFAEILNHYGSAWETTPAFYFFDKGPADKLPYNFRVLEFAPVAPEDSWTYATCCMSLPSDPDPMELHIFSPQQDHRFIDLLAAITFYHHNTKKLGLHHSFNFGKPLLENSQCKFGYISSSPLDKRKINTLELKEIGVAINFYWIMPITEAELSFKNKFGAETLEERFDSRKINYTDFLRESVV